LVYYRYSENSFVGWVGTSLQPTVPLSLKQKGKKEMSKKNKANFITTPKDEPSDDAINSAADLIATLNNDNSSDSDNALNSAIEDDLLLLADELADENETVTDTSNSPLDLVADEKTHFLPQFNPNIAWKVMIVDDEPEVHEVTRFALANSFFKEKPITFISAYSGEEAKSLLINDPDIALIFLDVVMETNHEGLRLTQHIRNTLKNDRVQIIIRTGQPGEVSEKEIVMNYEINDYRLKVELTQHKLYVIMITSLRAYYDLMSFENKNTLTRILLNNINIGIFRTHIDGQILNANLALAKMYGFASIDEFMRKPIMTRYVDLNIRKQLFSKLSEHGHVKNFEVQTRHGDGTIFDVSVSGILKYDDKGNPLFIEGVLEDITQRKEMRETLIKERASIAQRLKDCIVELRKTKADLERANRVKEEFFSIMSHELRTPLSTVLTMSELLQDDTYGPLNKEQSKAIGYIEDSGNHLLSLITDILLLSRIEAGQIQLKMIPLQIDTLCENSLQFVRTTAQQKQIKLFKVTDGNVTSLQADESGLTQILRHLLSNAVKFTPKGGQVRLEITGDKLDGVVQISVIDTGIGIAEDKIESLFQPFVQLDTRLARQYEGIGLGLSLIYRLVKLHGGSVSVESEIGKGSHFTILLPWQGNESFLAPEKSSEKHQPEQSKKHQTIKKQTVDSGTLLILLAEDYESNIAVLEKNLQAEGYQVVFASRAEEITDLIKEPALILMDIQMSDDIKVIEHIRTFTAFANIPIIVLSALIIPGDRERYLQAGANHYLSKPVNIKKLVRVIEEAQL